MHTLWKQASIFTALVIITAIVLIGTLGAPASAKTKTIATGNAVLPAGGVQDVTLTFRNYAYSMDPAPLVRGVPVRLTVDLSTVTGCMRDIVIPAFNVRKYVREGDNVIEFTPDQSGTFNIHCSMNMGRGTFIVAEPDGSTTDYVEEPDEDAGSCGGSGGCGCGGY